MVDDVLLNKSAIIERCVHRAREEYQAAGANFATDYTRQDAAILNLQRACEAALDIANHLTRLHKLGIPQSARSAFELLEQGGLIPGSLAEAMKNMVGFRNIAVHDYQSLLLPITERIITQHLDEFLAFTAHLLKR
ncbi:MAG: DUF86 domain-containing protein [Aquabacterium sp.]|jgi:uncharacterized protein YutE (UPF0331/DUF86 family)|nr:DUF86 domain-containing protein [Aquabacterium sp.]MBP7484027.1 DUF86 domain-containing protein [Aquabacterium sp.]MBP8190665.1 DUF86 domain-containing protein [Aquabacterium sp.]MCC6218044.1 DUF86 domain-containing protein [Aquabacterium sp.]